MSEQVPDYVSQPEQFEGADSSLVLLCKAIGDELEKHYPGWGWAITPEAAGGGVLSILALRLSGEWGYRFRLADIQGNPKLAMRKIRKGAGEILERFGVPRGAYQYADWVATRKFAGIAIPDVSDKQGRVQRQARDDAFTQAVRFGTAGLKIRDTETASGTYRQIAVRLA